MKCDCWVYIASVGTCRVPRFHKFPLIPNLEFSPNIILTPPSRSPLPPSSHERSDKVTIMAPLALSDIISALPSDDNWGPTTSVETTLDGVPYAPYSKGDKLGRMADWTSDSKDSSQRGRQNYNRNYRGLPYFRLILATFTRA